MKTHELKTWPEYFREVRSGAKPFEARKDDRGFEVGDTVVLREYEPDGEGRYTGDFEARVITYILRGTSHLAPGHCILGFGKVP